MELDPEIDATIEAVIAQHEANGTVDEALVRALATDLRRRAAVIRQFKLKVAARIREAKDAAAHEAPNAEALARRAELGKVALRVFHERIEATIDAIGRPMPCLKLRARPKPDDEDDE
ncbi:MAG: hypothetical protein JNK05_35365 [Myxococcales bacterium]|nr:hypothetical protein [Myxococcales bacterium]